MQFVQYARQADFDQIFTDINVNKSPSEFEESIAETVMNLLLIVILLLLILLLLLLYYYY